MKIGIDARTLMDDNYSGISECTLNLIRAMLVINSKNNEHEIKLFYNSLTNKKNIPKFENVERIYTRYPNKFFNYILQKIFHFPKIDKLLDVDSFFMPHFNFVSLSKAKKNLTVHDLSFLKYPSFFNKRKNFWHKMLNVGKIIKTSDKIVAISENTKRDIVDIFDIKSDKIKVVHNGISDEFKKLDRSNKDLEEIKEKYNLPNDFILFLGTIEPRKNIKNIILSFDEFIKKQKNKDIELVIIGQLGWSSDDVLDVARQSKNKIRFLGYIPKEEKVYFYNLASIFLFPSFYEGFGLPPLEAMACGTPVITSNASSLLKSLIGI